MTAFFETTLTRDRVDRLTGSGDWPNRLLNDVVDEHVAARPEKTAIVDARSRYTYLELRRFADAAALAFLEAGIRRGDVVTVQLPNWNEFVIVLIALERIGAVMNPVAPIFRHREMGSILRLGRPAAAVYPAAFRGFAYPPMYAELAREHPLRLQVAVGDGDCGGAMPWAEFLDRGTERQGEAPWLPDLRPGPHDVIELMFTSGTTGEPKGVMHTANTIAAGIDPLARALGYRPDDVFHMASTVGHQTGYLYGVQTALRQGSRLVFQEVWDAREFVKLVDAERVTVTMGATPFLADTLSAPNLAEHETGSLRIFICGGAPIPGPLAEKISERLPRCRLVPVWGMTEIGIVTAVLGSDPDVQVTSSDGRTFGAMEAVVRRPDGSTAEPGEEGDLFARGPATFAGYVQGRDFTAGFFDPDGWFTTGDRARMDAGGFVRITGRSKDLIIRGGENVPVKEIEDVLARSPKLRVVAVVAVPHARLGEIGCACVVPEPGETPTLEELQALLERERVTRQFWPERIHVMDEFPMTPSGKIQKFRLREIVAEIHGS